MHHQQHFRLPEVQWDSPPCGDHSHLRGTSLSGMGEAAPVTTSGKFLNYVGKLTTAIAITEHYLRVHIREARVVNEAFWRGKISPVEAIES